MPDTPPPFNPDDLTKYLQGATKQTRLNAHLKEEFKKLQDHVAAFAKMFEEDYQLPEPKVRAKRGTGAIAQKKKAALATQTAGTSTESSAAKPAGDSKPEASGAETYTTSKGTTLKVPGLTPAATPAANVIRKEDQ